MFLVCFSLTVISCVAKWLIVIEVHITLDVPRVGLGQKRVGKYPTGPVERVAIPVVSVAKLQVEICVLYAVDLREGEWGDVAPDFEGA